MDKDGLEDDLEITLYGTDPNNPDTDGDGVLDGADAFPLDPERWAFPVGVMHPPLLLVLALCLTFLSRKQLLGRA